MRLSKLRTELFHHHCSNPFNLLCTIRVHGNDANPLSEITFRLRNLLLLYLYQESAAA